MQRNDRHARGLRRLRAGTALVAMFAVGLIVTDPGAGSATPPTEPSCAQGGVCAIGDTGPGGGTVFFVAGEGVFIASRAFPSSGDAYCVSSCSDTVVSVELTAGEQAALPFDYLEAAPASGEAIRYWSGGQAPVPGAASGAIGSGSADTTAIMSTFIHDNATFSAAYYAIAYRGGGLADWFLPSYDELALILIEQESLSTSMGTFYANQWSSTGCCGGGAARALDFGSGQPLWVTPNAGDLGVRPVRAFSVTVLPETTTTTSTTATTEPATTTATTEPATTTATTESATTAPASTAPATTSAPATTTATTEPAPSEPTTASTAPIDTVPPTTTPPGTVPSATDAARPDDAPLTELAVLQMPLGTVGAPTVLAMEQQVTATGDQFDPGAAIEVYVASEPLLVGGGSAADDGSFSLTFTLPADLIGAHSIVIMQPSSGRSVRQAVQIVTAELPRTGSNNTPLEALAIAALLLGGGCIVVARRRVAVSVVRRRASGVGTSPDA